VSGLAYRAAVYLATEHLPATDSCANALQLLNRLWQL